MISNIKTKGYLGLDIDQPCSSKMVFVGDNRTGKTTRVNAIHLALNGFVATGNKVTKKANDILSQYSNDNKLVSEITIDGTVFEHTLLKKESGSVSTKFRINQANYKKDDYYQNLFMAGNPKIIDLSNFIDMSDNKKIDTLFRLFPAKVDIGKLNQNIAITTAKRNKFKVDIDKKKMVIQENTKSKQDIELPAGSLAEVQKAIEETTADYQECRDKITVINDRVKQAEIEKERQEIIRKHKADQQKEPEPNNRDMEKDFNESMKNSGSNLQPSVSKYDPVKVNESILMKELNRAPIDSLKRVKSTMERAGCNICAALLVIKKEIGTYSENG